MSQILTFSSNHSAGGVGGVEHEHRGVGGGGEAERYTPNPNVLAKSQQKIDDFKLQNKISVMGKVAPSPVMHVDEANLPPHIMDSLQKNNISVTTAIQAIGWPIALSSTDMIGVAETGSGKTLGVSSFWIPDPIVY